MSHEPEMQDGQRVPRAGDSSGAQQTLLERTVFLPGTQRMRWFVLAAGLAGLGLGFGTGAAVFAPRTCVQPNATEHVFAMSSPKVFDFHRDFDGRHGYLGVSIDPHTIEVQEVISGSAAERAGLEVGDRIIEIGHHELEPVACGRDFVNAVRSYDPGTTLRLKIVRDGNEKVLEATLGGISELEQFRKFIK